MEMNNDTDFRSMVDEPCSSTNAINDTSLSLILSLRINDQFLLQNRSNDRSNSGILSTSDYETSTEDQNNENPSIVPQHNISSKFSSCTISKNASEYTQMPTPSSSNECLRLTLNSNNDTADDTCKEKIWLNEKYEQNWINSTHPTSLVPLTSASNKTDNQDQSTQMMIICTPPLTKSPNTLSESSNTISYLSSLDERISKVLSILPTNTDLEPSTNKTAVIAQNLQFSKKLYISQWLASQIFDEPPTDLNLTALDLITLKKLSQAINTNIPSTINTKSSISISAKQLERNERKQQRYQLQRQIITTAKISLKPSFKSRQITKEQYKKIMKKVVTKATHSNKLDHKRIDKTIQAYVKKYQSVHSK